MVMFSQKMVWKLTQRKSEIPRPTDQAGVKRLLGMVNYVSKFIPNMSDLTAPLRELLHQDVEWHWEEQQEASFKKVKEALALSPRVRVL